LKQVSNKAYLAKEVKLKTRLTNHQEDKTQLMKSSRRKMLSVRRTFSLHRKEFQY